MNTRPKVLMGVLGVLCVVVIIVAYALLNRPSFYEALTDRNEHFRDAEQELWVDPVAAKGKYEQALARAESPAEEAYIHNMLALVQSRSGDFSGAIASAKQVIAGTDRYDAITRAYAAQGLAQTCVMSSGASEEVRRSLVDGIEGFTAREDARKDVCTQLYEYAAAIYPLAYAEFEIAKWHARQLFTAHLNAQPVADEIKMSHLIAIQTHAAGGNRDLARAQDHVTEAKFFMESTLRKAEVAAYVTLVGETVEGVSNPDALFKTALELAREEGSLDNEAATLFRYAGYIARQDPITRKEEVHTLLAPFYESERFAETPIVKFFLDTPTTAGQEVHEYVAAIALLDTQFGSYLQKKGWVIAPVGM